jgi:hypothetical protein
MNSQDQFAPIAALDLGPIKVKLVHKESGEGWSRAYADAVEFEYRRFLYLVKKFPHEHAAPLFDVDVFWHYHILDTMKYAADCEAVFGYFLHHFPYVEEDLEAHQQVGERMRELYERTYGKEYIRQDEATYAAASGKLAFCEGRLDEATYQAAGGKLAFCEGRLDEARYAAASGKLAFCEGRLDEATYPAASEKLAFCDGRLSVGPNIGAFSIGIPPASQHFR